MYRHYINSMGYYWFKTFKVYWAYRWFIAKEIDERGVLVQTKDNPIGILTKGTTNYQDRYE